MTGDNVYLLHKNGKVYERCRICVEALAANWRDRKRELRELKAELPKLGDPPSRYENEPWYPAYIAARDAAAARREKRDRRIGWTHA